MTKERMPTYAFVVTTWNGPKLVETISSIRDGERVLVVDTKRDNWSLAQGWNYGLRRILFEEEYEVAIVCNDDILLRPDTGERLAYALVHGQEEDRLEGEIHSAFQARKILALSAYNIRDVDRGDPEKNFPKYHPEDLNILDVNGEDVNFKDRWGTGCDFSCFAVTRETIQIIGPFDEEFKNAYYEDNDFDRRIWTGGFASGSYTPYYHYGSTTITTDKEREMVISHQGGFDRNKTRYIEKWGGLPGRETFDVPFNRQTVANLG